MQSRNCADDETKVAGCDEAELFFLRKTSILERRSEMTTEMETVIIFHSCSLSADHEVRDTYGHTDGSTW